MLRRSVLRTAGTAYCGTAAQHCRRMPAKYAGESSPPNARKIGRPSSLLLVHNSICSSMLYAPILKVTASMEICENDMKSETISYFHLKSCRISAYIHAVQNIVWRAGKGRTWFVICKMLRNFLHCPLYNSSHKSGPQNHLLAWVQSCQDLLTIIDTDAC